MHKSGCCGIILSKITTHVKKLLHCVHVHACAHHTHTNILHVKSEDNLQESVLSHHLCSRDLAQVIRLSADPSFWGQDKHFYYSNRLAFLPNKWDLTFFYRLRLSLGPTASKASPPSSVKGNFKYLLLLVWLIVKICLGQIFTVSWSAT